MGHQRRLTAVAQPRTIAGRRKFAHRDNRSRGTGLTHGDRHEEPDLFPLNQQSNHLALAAQDIAHLLGALNCRAIDGEDDISRLNARLSGGACYIFRQAARRPLPRHYAPQV